MMIETHKEVKTENMNQTAGTDNYSESAAQERGKSEIGIRRGSASSDPDLS